MTAGLDLIPPTVLPSTMLLAMMAGLLLYGWLMLGAWQTQRSASQPRKTKVKNDEKPVRDPLFPYSDMTNVGLCLLPLWALCLFFVIARSPNTAPDVLGLSLGAICVTGMAYGLLFPGISFLFGLLVRTSPIEDTASGHEHN